MKTQQPSSFTLAGVFIQGATLSIFNISLCQISIISPTLMRLLSLLAVAKRLFAHLKVLGVNILDVVFP